MFIIVVIGVLAKEVNSVGTDMLSIILKENRVPTPKNLHFLTKVRTRTGDVKISCPKRHTVSQYQSWK